MTARIDFGFTKVEEKTIKLGAAYYKLEKVDALERALAVAQALYIIQEHHYGDGTRGSYRDALIHYGFTDRSGTAPIDPALRSLYKDILTNQGEVTVWWNGLHQVDRDHWTSVRSIHRYWKEAKSAADASDEPDDEGDGDESRTRARRGNGRRKPATERLTINAPTGASMDEVERIAQAALHRPSAERLYQTEAEAAEAEAAAFEVVEAKPTLLGAIEQVWSLIDDPSQWPSTAKATRAQNLLRKALMAVMDALKESGAPPKVRRSRKTAPAAEA
jgi:hypothetical protein